MMRYILSESIFLAVTLHPLAQHDIKLEAGIISQDRYLLHKLY